jgi:hypothetical protein
MSTGTDAPALATLLRQFVELPRDQQWRLLVTALRHYADGITLPDRGGRLTAQPRR